LVQKHFQKVKTKFADKGIPVIVGEYGSTKVNKDQNSVRLYISTVCKTARDMGFCPMLWDPGTHFSRSNIKFTDSQLAAFFLQYKTAAPTIKIGDINNDGSIDALDFAALKKHLLGVELLTGNALKAADIDQSGSVDAIDFAQLKKLILGSVTV
jgi:endoglucanase